MGEKNQGSEKVDAMDNLLKTVSDLGNTLVDQVKSNAREVIDDSFQAAKDKISELVSFDELRQIVREHPWASVAGVLSVGTLIGLSRNRKFREPILSAMRMGVEIFQNQKQQNYNSSGEGLIRH